MLGAHRVGGVEALDKDAGDLAEGIDDRFVDEVEKAGRGWLIGLPTQFDGHRVRQVTLTARIHIVEQCDQTLLLDVGEGFTHGAAGQISTAGGPKIRAVRKFEPVLGPAEHGHEARRVLEQLKPARFLGGLCFRLRNCIGGLGAGAEKAQDLARVHAMNRRV